MEAVADNGTVGVGLGVEVEVLDTAPVGWGNMGALGRAS